MGSFLVTVFCFDFLCALNISSGVSVINPTLGAPASKGVGKVNSVYGNKSISETKKSGACWSNYDLCKDFGVDPADCWEVKEACAINCDMMLWDPIPYLACYDGSN